jgi:predicted esterase YcpF (UPF0227 family)
MAVSEYKDSYQFVDDLLKTYPQMPLAFLLPLCTGVDNKERQFRLGKFKVTKNKNWITGKAYEIDEITCFVKKICGVKVLKKNDFLAIYKIVSDESYDHENMLTKLNIRRDEVIESFKMSCVSNIYDRLYKKVYMFMRREKIEQD